ncbi:MAG: phospholipid/cholesterol/gamma-HCH transport system substrate-binding protein [Pseudonocardiales bacterium]|jgi:phospholipid/cholesterol/gamma-HCH transport system substrate-binding protein|nr:phospholipid/cholesterol/gamma-HCH transport system substrate-binding protein [Pseudonocardiales bacterium]
MSAHALRRRLRGSPRSTSIRIGTALIVLTLLAGYLLFHKNEILTKLRSGETIQVHFAAGTHLVPYLSQAKVAFVPVGVVTGQQRQADGSAIVSVKVDDGTRAKLGSTPSAVIRPTTLLGGNYFVDLVPGGDRVPLTGSIPQSRTSLPVELDKVAAVFQPAARAGVQGATKDLDRTLRAGAGSALDQLAADAPDLLRPAAGVLRAAQGTSPYVDLTGLVAGLDTTARVLTAKQGQLDDIIVKLHTTTGVLAAHSSDLSTALSQLPATMRSTQAGLVNLNVSLDKLRTTANSARPVVTALNMTLQHADPVLIEARPVVQQLHELLTAGEPLVQQLVPTAVGATAVLDNLQGPVLNRVLGPVKTWLLSPYHGSGSYSGTGSNKPLYEEVGYVTANLDRTSSMVDRNGHAIAFEPGVGAGSIGGLPISLEQMFTVITDRLHLTPGLGGQ